MTVPAIRVAGLIKHYGKHVALTDLTLDVAPGEVFGFLGPNGAGKSTTIRILLDLIRPTAGHVEIFGTDPRAGGAELRRRIGYLPGELALEGRNTARELLAFFADQRGTVPAGRIEELAGLLDLDLSKRVGSMSKGNKQKVGIIAAFMHSPDLLILDEPTSGLDPLLQQRFLDLVGEAKRNGQTVFMSSHILSEVQQTADRAVIMRAGQLLGTENVEELRRRAPRSVEMVFAADVFADDFERLPGVRDLEISGRSLRCTTEGEVDALFKTAAKYPLVSVLSTEPDLEQMFFSLYGR
ncbi:ABC transporter ATP-binding protein [Nocardia otitidiscaviarum]|uniref:ABC transporter ATP-binding protein n=1 Tax=Nocardia otitidiscaviarum TaxID=1823 RepID=A0A516NNC0_9NOCA|nr:ABC transporter ATP-binding protein [Nocardia otitidiscaviarum]MCP9624374.1 ABC transporter ATP-binding protein [Nocardia otitidiscaviarum]QDP80402.1 ABC transporter ATP-binding protein [Nocardia otitidiscaviarum]